MTALKTHQNDAKMSKFGRWNNAPLVKPPARIGALHAAKKNAAGDELAASDAALETA
ncbi:MAG: hypothetical protein V4578_21100 [Pseudomonadota bacterium]